MDYGCITGTIDFFDKKKNVCNIILDVKIKGIQPLLKNVKTLSIGSHENKICSLYKKGDRVLINISKACNYEDSFRDDGQIGFQNCYVIGSVNKGIDMSAMVKIYENMIKILDLINSLIDNSNNMTPTNGWGVLPKVALAGVKAQVTSEKNKLKLEHKKIYGY